MSARKQTSAELSIHDGRQLQQIVERLAQATAILGMVSTHVLYEDEQGAEAVAGAIGLIDQAAALADGLAREVQDDVPGAGGATLSEQR